MIIIIIYDQDYDLNNDYDQNYDYCCHKMIVGGEPRSRLDRISFSVVVFFDHILFLPGVALLPFVDEKRLLPALEKVYPDLTEEEGKRNGHCNNTFG